MKVKIEVIKNSDTVYQVEVVVSEFPKRGRGTKNAIVGKHNGWECKSWNCPQINATTKKIYLPGDDDFTSDDASAFYANKKDAQKAAKDMNMAIKDWIAKYKTWRDNDDD